MYKSMLFLHWKQIRHVLALAVIVSFSLPLLTVQGLGTAPGMDRASLDAYRFLATYQDWAGFFPLLALVIGVTMALSAWNWDHQLKHVYALSLPLSRWEYTLQKLLAGMTLCMLPAVGLWLGAVAATLSIELPTGLHAYPNELAVRYLFAMLLSYAVLFAMAAGTVRTTLGVTGAVLAFFVVGTLANDLLAGYVVYFQETEVVQNVFEWIMSGPGPFAVFTGNWSLIDV